jgi:aryl-alcohol dehydrogenase-like predicted oxidoreductase
METRTLGNSGLNVSRLGLGLAALGRPGYITLGHASDLAHDYDAAHMEAHAHAVLDAAWAGGIRYFDVARSYGRGEQFLASWLASRTIRPADVTIGSKWGYTYTADWRVEAARHEIKDHSVAVLRRQIGESKAILGDHLDLYQIHSVTLESGVLDDAAVLDELRRLRASGLRIGGTVTGPRQPQTLQRALEVGIFDSVQATWNLLEPSTGPALQAAHDAGLGIIVKEPLANGRLTARNRELAFARQRQALQDVATELGATLDALALAAVLAQPWADVVLSGAATIDQLRSNLAATDVRLDATQMERLGTLAEPADRYWQTRAEMSWN